jgi:hypothetical protein
MNKKSRTIIIVAGGLLLLVIVVIMMQNRSRFDWYENYKIESKEPYGGYVMGEMLKGHYPGRKFSVFYKSLRESLPYTGNARNKNYILIGSSMQTDSADLAVLLLFVHHGNRAFISTKYKPEALLSSIFHDTCSASMEEQEESAFRDSIAHLNFYSPALRSEKDYRVNYVFRNQSYSYPWSYYDSTFFCGKNNEAVSLGYLDGGYTNFLKVKTFIFSYLRILPSPRTKEKRWTLRDESPGPPVFFFYPT